MKILENQTLYQCSYCEKRLLTKKGCELHEKEYCKNEDSPHVKNCKHKNIMPKITYEYDNLGQIDYDYCDDCGKIMDED